MIRFLVDPVSSGRRRQKLLYFGNRGMPGRQSLLPQTQSPAQQRVGFRPTARFEKQASQPDYGVGAARMSVRERLTLMVDGLLVEPFGIVVPPLRAERACPPSERPADERMVRRQQAAKVRQRPAMFLFGGLGAAPAT